MKNTTSDIKSPCIGVCAYDFEKGFCQGCYRDIKDITRWWEMREAEKREALKRCKKNRKRVGGHPDG